MKQFSFCPICGTQYKQSLTSQFVHECDNCGYIFHENLTVSTIGIIIHEGKILLTKRKFPPQQGAWDLPGGFVEPTEHPEQGIVREMREELGVESRVEKLLFVYAPVEYKYKEKVQFNCDLIYLLKPMSLDFKPNDDVESVQWFSKDELPNENQLSFSSVKEVVKRFKEGKLL